MKVNLITFFFLFSCSMLNAQFVATEVGTLPEKVSNNAVCEGFIDGSPYLFSFGGIDSTKIYSGIHLRSFRYNIETGQSETIPDLPDDLGKIAAGASRVGDIIYIAGGYNVFANSSESSTNKMHRYDILNNQYLSDAKDIPIPTDDHVQAVWRDSLIYLITGWNDTANIPNVQIYNPSSDEWSMGTNVPNIDSYKSFGASGVIYEDVIYYFGGARSSAGFNIQNNLRIGIINPSSPTEIEWSIQIPDLLTNGYRMAATSVNDELHWLGGSNKTYNFNGVAYDGSGTVSPSNRDLFLTPTELEWNQKSIQIPMDLRGIADVSNTVKYIAGGMLENREVTDKVYRLEWQDPTATINVDNTINVKIGPNPFQNVLTIEMRNQDQKIDQVIGFDMTGNTIFSDFPHASRFQKNTDQMAAGIYYIQLKIGDQTIYKKVIRTNS